MITSILTGTFMQLEPLQEQHRAELAKIVQDKQIWTYLPSQGSGDKFNAWFDKALENYRLEKHLPFLARELKNKQAVGTTRFYDIEPKHQRLALGYTWYIPSVWGTQVNPECKLLLLTYVFEQLNYNRIEFYTDANNVRSRAALKKLGAKAEGIFRSHMILENGNIRDTVCFSIIKTEWPEIKINLTNRLQMYHNTPHVVHPAH